MAMCGFSEVLRAGQADIGGRADNLIPVTVAAILCSPLHGVGGKRNPDHTERRDERQSAHRTNVSQRHRRTWDVSRSGMKGKHSHCVHTPHCASSSVMSAAFTSPSPLMSAIDGVAPPQLIRRRERSDELT